MTTKYVFVYRKKNIFNPAAISLLILDLLGIGLVAWWVGSSIMSAVVIVVGLLIVRKLRRFHMFLAFMAVSAFITMFTGVSRGLAAGGLLIQFLISGPVIFFGTIMLTEPSTTPPTRLWQVVYGTVIGLLYGTNFRVGPVFSSPELALVLGNIFSFAVGFKQRIVLTLREKNHLTSNISEFAFIPDRKFIFFPGQYMEWTLGHRKPDSRGNRRYFTIASSPTETDIRLCSRFNPERSSSFKAALLNLNIGDKLSTAQLDGEFTLPEDRNEKVVFIAGGIGITPFRSMIKYLVDREEQRSMTLFYVNKVKEDIVYQDLFQQGEMVGLKTVYVLTEQVNAPKDWVGKLGYIDKKMILSEAPDFEERTFYMSGPSAMVDNYRKLLLGMGVKRNRIMTDYFPGY